MNPNTLRLDSALLSDIGMRRKQNQDSGITRPDLGLFVVADGMGGHQGGEIASKLCVERIQDFVETTGSNQENDAILLQMAMQAANLSIHDAAAKDPKLSGMGTTATTLKIKDQIATILQVGDSRAYFWNQEGIWQLTRDHSLVQEKLRAGLITREQMKSDEMKNVITRSVGYEPSVRGDAYQMEIRSGDGFLLCSDGLTGPVSDEKIYDLLLEGDRRNLPLSETAERLIHAANALGGDDNSTVILVKVVEI